MNRQRPPLLALGLAATLLAAAACNGPETDLPSHGVGPGGNWEFVAPEVGDTGGVGGESGALVEVVCGKLSECGLLDAEELEECRAAMGREIPFIIDAEAFSSCLSSLSCGELAEESFGELLLDCVDIDMQSLSCTGDSLHYCNGAGSCKTTPCTEICSFFEEPGRRCVSVGGFGLCECMLGRDELEESPESPGQDPSRNNS